jgi:hypothetical protein
MGRREGDRGCAPQAFSASNIQRAARGDTDCGGSEFPPVLTLLATIDRPAKGLNFFPDAFRDLDAAVCDAVLGVANPVLRFFRPFIEGIAGVFVASFQVAAELLAGLGRE